MSVLIVSSEQGKTFKCNHSLKSLFDEQIKPKPTSTFEDPLQDIFLCPILQQGR